MTSAERPPEKEPKSYGTIARKGGGWTIWRQTISLLIQIPTSMIMARLLTPTEFGIAAVSAMVVQFGNRLSQFGLNAALVRTKSLRREHETSMFVFNLVVGITMYVTLVAASPFVGRFFGSVEAGQLIGFAALVFVIAPFGTVPGALLTRQFKFRELAGLAFIDTVIAAVTSVLLAWSGFSYWSVPAGVLAGTLASTVRRHLLSKWRMGFGFSWLALRELLAYGSGVQLKRFIQYGSANLDTLIVGRLLGVTPLGLYDKGFSTMSRLTQRMTFGAGVTFRIFANIADDGDRLRGAYRKTMTVAGLVTLPTLAAAGLTAHELFLVMYGAQWVESVPVFQWLCLAGGCQVLTLYVGNVNEATGWIWRQVAGQAVVLAVLATAVYFGASAFGVVGAAAGMALAAACDLLLSSAILIWSTPVGWRDVVRPFAVPVLCATGLVLLLLGLRQAAVAAGVESPFALLAAEAVAGAAYLVLFALWCPTEEYRAVARDFVEDLTPRMPARAGRWLNARFAGAGSQAGGPRARDLR